ncbi:CG8965 [Drosophila busckii]|uniref:CG8965 n=2 Tax=Drosophila busckii TaxID=30019 RepID=A0A0M4E6I4_DROBS|nr:CG8965 [Drosophila busckii]
MLKHVQISPLRNRSDSLSLRSASNASSCASSMCGSPEPPTDMLRTTSRASSYSSLNEQLPQTTIKVYTNCLKIDIEYKTLGIQWDTTSKEVIAQLLRRLKMRHRDPRLFYLSMEVAQRRAGVKTILVLDEDTRPAILQACHPKGESRFCLQLKPGGLIRVHTSALQPTSQYKSLVISEETNCDELLQLLLGCYNSLEPVEHFSLYEVCPGQECQRKLHADDFPLRAQAERLRRGENCHFLVRRTPNYARRRQLLANLNEAINQSTTSVSSAAVEDADAASLLELSLESELSLPEDLRSCSSSSEDAEDDECASSSGSSDNSTECTLRRDFFQRSSAPPAAARASTASATSASPPTRAYSPVYNIREIRTATHSFSSLGKDKKLLDIHMHARYAPSGIYSRLLPVAEVDTALDVNGNASAANLTAEAVNNNPAQGLGHFV